MDIKFIEKISNFEDYIFNALTDSNYEDCLNQSRKAAEALCKSIVYQKLNAIEASEFLNGKRTVNNPSVSNPRSLDLNGLIQLVTTSNENYSFIEDKTERNLIKNVLDQIRLLGNGGSHERESVREIQTKLEHNTLKSNIFLLIDWFYNKFYKSVVPNRLLQLLKNNLVFQELNDIQGKVEESELFYNQLREWLEVLEYVFGSVTYNLGNDRYFDIEIPARRNSVERILVISTTENINYEKAQKASDLQVAYDCVEVWIVTSCTVNDTARNYGKNVFCYTFDELIEENFALDTYFQWLEEYVTERKIVENFISLNCQIREEHPVTKRIIAQHSHDLVNYTDRWLQHNKKEHLSILGDFGTGKTWFSLYYAYRMAKKYLEAKEKGLPRPRIPIIIFLRDYAKAVSVETLISDFFFRRHQIDLKGAFSAFNYLNRQGKLLMIFDGFDEMSDRVNKQKMIDNFWELASIIKGQAKVILTCRNEHFPQIRDGRSVLKAELRESTKHLTGTTPQFETIHLELLNKHQIETILNRVAKPDIIANILNNKGIFDLLKRPIMLDLILESISDLTSIDTIDLAIIYLYATKNKLARDIKEERTFTSLADKYLFMCEISQEMLHNDKLSISYKEFPDLIRKYFSQVAKDDEIDYWRFDMHGQTLLIIDEDGQYKPAHKSFLEFFLAYKYVAMLGVLKSDFVGVVQERSDLDNSKKPRIYTWDEYFNVERKNYGSQFYAPLSNFVPTSIDILSQNIGKDVFTKPMVDLAYEMIDWSKKDQLERLVEKLRNKSFEEIGYLATNIIFLLFKEDVEYTMNRDFSNLCLRNLDFNIVYNQKGRDDFLFYDDISFKNSKFFNCDLAYANLSPRNVFTRDIYKYTNTIFDGSYLDDNFLKELQIDDICFVDDGGQYSLIIGAHDELLLCSINEIKALKRIDTPGWATWYLKEKGFLITSNWGRFDIWDLKLNHLREVAVSTTFNELKDNDQENMWLTKFHYYKKTNELIVISSNSTLYRIDLKDYKEKTSVFLPYSCRDIVTKEHSEHLIILGYDSFFVFDLNQNNIIYKEDGKFILDVHPKLDFYFINEEDTNMIQLRETNTHSTIHEVEIEERIEYIKFSHLNDILYVFLDRKIVLVSFKNNTLSIAEELDLYFKDIDSKPDRVGGFGRVDKVECLEDGLLILKDNSVIEYSFKEKRVIKYFNRFPDFSETHFEDCKGLSDDTKNLIFLNGGKMA